MDAKLIGASSSYAIFSPCSTGIPRLSGSFAQETWDKNYNFWIQDSRDWQIRTLAVRASPPTVGLATKGRIDETQSYTLDGIRNSLIRQEDSIIFSLVERAQFCYNEDTYDPDAFAMDGFHSSLVEYMVKGTEKLHGKVGRYKSPDEHPFFPEKEPEPLLPPLQYPQVLHPAADSININVQVWSGTCISKLSSRVWLEKAMMAIVDHRQLAMQFACRKRTI